MRIALIAVAACTTVVRVPTPTPAVEVSAAPTIAKWWCYKASTQWAGGCARERSSCLTMRAKLEAASQDELQSLGESLSECAVADHAFCSIVQTGAERLELCMPSIRGCEGTLAIARKDAELVVSECRAVE